MIISEVNLNIWYDEYKKQFNKTSKYIKQHGGEVDTSPMTRRQFERDFRIIAESADAKIGGQKISKDLAKTQLQAISPKQAEAAARAYVDRTGDQMSLTLVADFRYNLTRARFTWEEVSQRSRQLGNEGIRGKARQLRISQEFFRSK